MEHGPTADLIRNELFERIHKITGPLPIPKSRATNADVVIQSVPMFAPILPNAYSFRPIPTTKICAKDV
jgi:hypothetical protein